MKKGRCSWVIAVIGVVLMMTLTIPGYAQPTISGDTENPDNFSEFISCLFDDTGEATTDDTEENVIDAIQGTAQSAPTEQDIRDCFEPIYEPERTVSGPATSGSGVQAGEEEDDTDGGVNEGGNE
jgi:hypothetical protein